MICLLYTFSAKEIPFKHNYMGTSYVSCGMFSNVIIRNVISLILRDSDTDLENVSLIWRIFDFFSVRSIFISPNEHQK